jgi:hypothetical protein
VANPAAGSPGTQTGQETEERMRAIAAELTAAGLDAHLHDTRGVLDITATVHQPACREPAHLDIAIRAFGVSEQHRRPLGFCVVEQFPTTSAWQW